jgi:hypothetical protein
LKLVPTQTIEIFEKVLTANKAKGNRKHIRAICPLGTGQFNVEIDGQMCNTDIQDISSVGMAIFFHNCIKLDKGTILIKLSILVKGVRLIVDGFVAMQRLNDNGSLVSIIMFLPTSLDEQRTNKLKMLVYKINQHIMEQKLLTMN